MRRMQQYLILRHCEIFASRVSDNKRITLCVHFRISVVKSPTVFSISQQVTWLSFVLVCVIVHVYSDLRACIRRTGTYRV